MNSLSASCPRQNTCFTISTLNCLLLKWLQAVFVCQIHRIYSCINKFWRKELMFHTVSCHWRSLSLYVCRWSLLFVVRWHVDNFFSFMTFIVHQKFISTILCHISNVIKREMSKIMTCLWVFCCCCIFCTKQWNLYWNDTIKSSLQSGIPISKQILINWAIKYTMWLSHLYIVCASVDLRLYFLSHSYSWQWLKEKQHQTHTDFIQWMEKKIKTLKTASHFVAI